MNDFKQYRGRGRGSYQHNNNFRGPIFNNVRRGSPNNFAPLLPLTHFRDNRFRWQRPQQVNLWRSPPARMPYMHPHMPPPFIQRPPVESRPVSPLPGSEEARQKVIAEASARIKEQLNLNENNNFNTTTHVQSPMLNSDNFNNEPFIIEEFPKNVCDKPSEKSPKKKTKKSTSISSETNTNTNIEELRNKILAQFTYMSKGKIQNLVNNPGSSRYDGALQHLVRDMRLHLSSELRNMYNNRETDSKENNEMIDHFNSIVPDLGVELVSLPDTMVAELSKILQFDVNNDLQEKIPPLIEENNSALVEPEDMFKQAEKLLLNTDFLDVPFENSNLQSNEPLDSINPFMPDFTADLLIEPPLSTPCNKLNNDPFMYRSPIFNEPPPNPIMGGDLLEPTDMDIDFDENLTVRQEENLADKDLFLNLNTIPLPNPDLQQLELEETSSTLPHENNIYNTPIRESSPFSKKILEANLSDGASVLNTDYCTSSIPNSNPIVDPLSNLRTETRNKSEGITDPQLFDFESIWASKPIIFKNQSPPKTDNSVTNITSFLDDVISNSYCDKTKLRNVENSEEKNNIKVKSQQQQTQTKIKIKEKVEETISTNRLSLDERIKMMITMQEANVKKSEQIKPEDTSQLTKNQRRKKKRKMNKLKMDMMQNLNQSQQLNLRKDFKKTNILDSVVVKQEKLDVEEKKVDTYQNQKQYKILDVDSNKNDVSIQESLFPNMWIKPEKDINNQVKRNVTPTKAILKEIPRQTESIRIERSAVDIKKNSTTSNFPIINLQTLSITNKSENGSNVISPPVKDSASKNILEKRTEKTNPIFEEISDNTLQTVSFKHKENDNIIIGEKPKVVTDVIPKKSNNTVSNVRIKITSESCTESTVENESKLKKKEVSNAEKAKQNKIRLIRNRNENLKSITETNEEKKSSSKMETLQTSQQNEVLNSMVKDKDKNMENIEIKESSVQNCDSTVNIQNTNIFISETEAQITGNNSKEIENIKETVLSIQEKTTDDCKINQGNVDTDSLPTKENNEESQQEDKDNEETQTNLQSKPIVSNILTNNQSEKTENNELNVTENNGKELNSNLEIITNKTVENTKVDVSETNLIVKNEPPKEELNKPDKIVEKQKVDVPEINLIVKNEPPKEELRNKPDKIVEKQKVDVPETNLIVKNEPLKEEVCNKPDENLNNINTENNVQEKDAKKKENKSTDKDNVEKPKENKTKSSRKSSSKERENVDIKKHSKIDETVNKEINISKTCHSSKSDSTKDLKERERSRSKSKSKTKHHSDHSKKSYSSSHHSKKDKRVSSACTQTEIYIQENSLSDLNKVCLNEESIVSRLMTIDMQIQNLMQEKWDLYKQLNIKRSETVSVENKSEHNSSKKKNEVTENLRIRPLSTTPSESSCFSDLALNFKKQREIRSVSLTRSESSVNDLEGRRTETDKESEKVINKRKRAEPKDKIKKTVNEDNDLNIETSKTSRKRSRSKQITNEKSTDDAFDCETSLRKRARIEKKVEPKKTNKAKNTKSENKLDVVVNITTESSKDHTIPKKTNKLEELNESLNIKKKTTDVIKDEFKIETLDKNKQIIEEKLHTENSSNEKQSARKQKKKASNTLITDITEEPNKKFYIKIKKPEKKAINFSTDDETIDTDIQQEMYTNKNKSNKVTNQDKKLDIKSKINHRGNEKLKDDISNINLEEANESKHDNLLEINVEKSIDKVEDTEQTNTEIDKEFEYDDKETNLKNTSNANTSSETLNNNKEINSAVLKKSNNYNLKHVKVCLTEFSNEIINKSKIDDSNTENKNTDVSESTSISSETKIKKKNVKRSKKTRRNKEHSQIKPRERFEVSETDEQKFQYKISKIEEERLSSRESSLDIPSSSKIIALQTKKRQKRLTKDDNEDRYSRSRSTSKECDFRKINKSNKVIGSSEDETDNQPLQFIKKRHLFSESETSDSSHIDDKLRIEKKINSKRKRNFSNDANLSEIETINKTVSDSSVVKSCVIKLERIDLKKKYKYDPNTLKYTPKDFIYTSTLISPQEVQNDLIAEETKSDEICENISHISLNLNSEDQSKIIQLENDSCTVDNLEEERTNEENITVENVEIIEHENVPDIAEITELKRSEQINSESDNVDENGLFCMGHQKSILDIKIIGDEFLAASEDGTVYKYCLKTGNLQDAYTGHKRAVTCMYVMHGSIIDVDATIMYSGSLDCTLKCYNIETAEILHSVTVEQAIQCMDSAWGHIFLGTYDGLLFIYNIKKKLLNDISLTIANATVLMIKATQEGSRQVLILASRKKEIMVRDAFSGLLLRTMCQDQKPTIYSLLLDRSLVYCGTSDKGILILNFNNGNQVGLFNSGKGVVCMVIYKCLLFAGCYDGMIYVYNTKTQEYVTTLPGPGEGMLLSLAINEDMIIAGTKKNHLLKIWKIPQEILRQSD